MLSVVGVCIFSSVGMMSALAWGLTFGFHTIELIILAVFTIVGLFLIIPSLFLFAWTDEIEKILEHRQIDIGKPIHKRVQGWTLKMFFWAVLIILAPSIIRWLSQ